MATAGYQLIAGAPGSANGAGAAIRFVAALIHVAGPEAELHTDVDVGAVILELIAGPEDVHAVEGIAVHLVARHLIGVRSRDHLDPMPAIALPGLRAVAHEGIAIARDQDAIEGVLVHAAVVAHGIIGALHFDAVAAVALHGRGPEGVAAGASRELHTGAGVAFDGAAAEVVEAPFDPNAHRAAAHRIVAHTIVVAKHQNADLAGPAGPHALQVMAIRVYAPADGAAHGVAADDGDRPGAGDVHHRSRGGGGELSHGTLGDGQAVGAGDDHVLRAAPVDTDHLAVLGLIHGLLEGDVRGQTANQRRIVAFRVDGTGEDRISVFRALQRTGTEGQERGAI